MSPQENFDADCVVAAGALPVERPLRSPAAAVFCTSVPARKLVLPSTPALRTAR
jgi:hypothetical protein